MVRTRQIAVVLIAACLSGCGYAMFDADTTASFHGAGNATAKADLMRSVGVVPQLAAPPSEPAVTRANTEAPPVVASNRADAAAMNSLFARASAETAPGQQAPAVKPIPIATTDDAVKPVDSVPPTEKVTIMPRGRAYLFRGVAGLIYSRGMDALAERINRAGISASVNTYLM